MCQSVLARKPVTKAMVAMPRLTKAISKKPLRFINV